MSDYDRALSAYERALHHNPNSLTALMNVAGICRMKENYGKVRFCFSWMHSRWLRASHLDPPPLGGKGKREREGLEWSQWKCIRRRAESIADDPLFFLSFPFQSYDAWTLIRIAPSCWVYLVIWLCRLHLTQLTHDCSRGPTTTRTSFLDSTDWRP